MRGTIIGTVSTPTGSAAAALNGPLSWKPSDHPGLALGSDQVELSRDRSIAEDAL